MKDKPFSVRRRQLVVGGVAGIAAPAALFAAPRGNEPRDGLPGEKFVISGRILDADRKPLAGATIEAWHPQAQGERAISVTDADGRFFASIAPTRHSGGMRYLDYRVSHPVLGALPARRLHLTRAPGVSGDRLAALQRDETGMWRASFGVALA